MALVKEDISRDPGPLTFGRDPSKVQKTVGKVAVNDALLIVAVAWIVLFFLAGSLRHHNI